MKRGEAERLARRIERDDEGMSVTGLRRYGTNDYGVEATDTRTGYDIVVNSVEEWDYRMMEMERRIKAFEREQLQDTLMAAADIATLAEVTVNAVHQWAKRYPEFRALASETSAGLIWRRGDVEEWLEKTGRR